MIQKRIVVGGIGDGIFVIDSEGVGHLYETEDIFKDYDEGDWGVVFDVIDGEVVYKSSKDQEYSDQEGLYTLEDDESGTVQASAVIPLIRTKRVSNFYGIYTEEKIYEEDEEVIVFNKVG